MAAKAAAASPEKREGPLLDKRLGVSTLTEQSELTENSLFRLVVVGRLSRMGIKGLKGEENWSPLPNDLERSGACIESGRGD